MKNQPDKLIKDPQSLTSALNHLHNIIIYMCIMNIISIFKMYSKLPFKIQYIKQNYSPLSQKRKFKGQGEQIKQLKK